MFIIYNIYIYFLETIGVLFLAWTRLDFGCSCDNTQPSPPYGSWSWTLGSLSGHQCWSDTKSRCFSRLPKMTKNICQLLHMIYISNSESMIVSLNVVFRLCSAWGVSFGQIQKKKHKFSCCDFSATQQTKSQLVQNCWYWCHTKVLRLNKSCFGKLCARYLWTC